MESHLEFYLIFGLIFPLGMYYQLCIAFMFLNVAKGQWRINALLPLALFTPGLFNEKGNIYRKRALAISIIVLLAALYVINFGA
jgi:hypothetical protein